MANARKANGAPKRARVYVDPIGRGAPTVPEIHEDSERSFWPYSSGDRSWFSYPVRPTRFPEYRDIGFLFAYQFRIVPDFRRLKKVFRSLKGRCRAKIYVSGEMQQSTAGQVSYEDTRKTYPPVCPYRGILQLALVPARVLSPLLKVFREKENQFCKTFLPFSFNTASLAGRIRFYNQFCLTASDKSLRDLYSLVSAVNTIKSSYECVGYSGSKTFGELRLLKVNFNQGAAKAKTLDCALADDAIGRRLGYYTITGKIDLARFFKLPLSLNISSTRRIRFWAWHDTRRFFVNPCASTGFKIVPLDSFRSLHFGLEWNVIQTDLEGSTLRHNWKLLPFLRKSFVATKALNPFLSSILLDPKNKIEKVRKFKVFYYEDDAAEAEVVEIGTCGYSWKDKDVTELYHGGTADGYASFAVFGWDTISRNPKSHIVQINRSRQEKQTRDFSLTQLNYIPAYGLPAKISAAFVGEGFKSVLTIGEPSYSMFREINSFQTLLFSQFVGLRDVLAFAPLVERETTSLSYYFDTIGFMPLDNTVIQSVFPFIYSSVSLDTLISSAWFDSVFSFSNSFSPFSALIHDAPSFNEPDPLLPSYCVGSKYGSKRYLSDLFVEHEYKIWSSRAVYKNYSSSSYRLPSLLLFQSYDNRFVGNLPSVRFFSTFDRQTLSWKQVSNNLFSFAFSKKHYGLYSSSYALNVFDAGYYEDEWFPSQTSDDVRGEPEGYSFTLRKEDVSFLCKLFYARPISYIDYWKPYYQDEEGNFVNLPEEEQTTTEEPSGLPGTSWVNDYGQRVLNYNKLLNARALLALTQIGWGYTTPPSVSIDAHKLDSSIREDYLSIPTFLSYDIDSDTVFEEGSVDTRLYDGPTIDRARAFVQPFKEWVEEEGEIFAFIYAMRMHYHIFNSMKFEKQTFMGCAPLKIIGSL
jgi:hypothetical protein